MLEDDSTQEVGNGASLLVSQSLKSSGLVVAKSGLDGSGSRKRWFHNGTNTTHAATKCNSLVLSNGTIGSVADYRKLGGLVREARLNKRLTQTEVAEGLSLSREQISQIERGRPKKPLDPEHINTFSRILGLNVLDLVVALGYEVRVPGIEDEEQATLLRLYQSALPVGQRAAIAVLQATQQPLEGEAI